MPAGHTLALVIYAYEPGMASYDQNYTIQVDNASVAAYATEPMTWAIAEGIISGTTAGLLNPAGTATRAQFAVILYRFFENVM